MIEQIAGIVAIYGLVFGTLWKLESFIVKRTDVEISDVSKNYYALVIRNDLKKIAEEIKEKKEVKQQVLDLLVQDVNRDNELKGLREDAEQYKKQSFIFSVFSMASVMMKIIDPSFAIFWITPEILIAISSLFAISGFISYYNFLNDTRKNIVEMEKAMQTAESIRF